MRYLVTGGTGFVGRALCASLAADRHAVTVLSRSPESTASQLRPGISIVQHIEDVEDVDVVINLQGENLASDRWTEARKLAFHTSRIGFTRSLVEWMWTRRKRPSTLISASAIGWYGDRGDEVLTESSAAGTGCAARLCAAWEAEALKAEVFGVRVCRLRIGMVLERDGGALAKMLPAFRLGAGGPWGPGTQWMSWITRRDLVRLIRWLVDSRLHGVFNATSPQPVRNREFARLLGRALRRPAVLPVPAFALRTILGERAELMLGSQRVMPDVARATGFEFEHTTLGAALDSVIG